MKDYIKRSEKTIIFVATKYHVDLLQ